MAGIARDDRDAADQVRRTTTIERGDQEARLGRSTGLGQPMLGIGAGIGIGTRAAIRATSSWPMAWVRAAASSGQAGRNSNLGVRANITRQLLVTPGACGTRP
ncbi:hypothetical protein P0F65_21515 [Sphingomonas sp. I4]